MLPNALGLDGLQTGWILHGALVRLAAPEHRLFNQQVLIKLILLFQSKKL